MTFERVSGKQGIRFKYIIFDITQNNDTQPKPYSAKNDLELIDVKTPLMTKRKWEHSLISISTIIILILKCLKKLRQIIENTKMFKKQTGYYIISL